MIDISTMTNAELEELKQGIFDELNKREEIKIDKLKNELNSVWPKIKKEGYDIYYSEEYLIFDEITIH